MTKICLGGSFNPIHLGHLLVARAVAEDRGFEKIVLIPSAQPPHKAEPAVLAGKEHRLNMCQIVSNADPLFEADGLELQRSGPSFTIDTVAELKQKGWPQVAWLIGADMLQILPTWHRWRELLTQVQFIIAQRPGYEIDWKSLPPEIQPLEQNVVRAPLLEISATQIRQRVREGKSIRYLVPPEIERYIADAHLYK